jgi:hypothetical protein
MAAKALDRTRYNRRQMSPPIDVVPDSMFVRLPQVPVQPAQAPGQLGAMARMIEAARANSPVYTPPAYAPGTPTQRRREADTSAGQWQQQFTYGQERDKIEDEWRRQMFNYQRQQDAIANALRQASMRSQEIADQAVDFRDTPEFRDNLAGYINDIHVGNKTIDTAKNEIEAYMRAGLLTEEQGKELINGIYKVYKTYTPYLTATNRKITPR